MLVLAPQTSFSPDFSPCGPGPPPSAGSLPQLRSPGLLAPCLSPLLAHTVLASILASCLPPPLDFSAPARLPWLISRAPRKHLRFPSAVPCSSSYHQKGKDATLPFWWQLPFVPPQEGSNKQWLRKRRAVAESIVAKSTLPATRIDVEARAAAGANWTSGANRRAGQTEDQTR